MAVSGHLNHFEMSIRPLWNEEALQEPIKEIFFLIHQSYIELDKADIQPFIVKLISTNEVFEDYFLSRIS
jgi:hypothetical protein